MALGLPIGTLFERYGAVVYRRCLALLRDPEAAQDAVQEVFVRAMTGADRFRGDASPLTWLYRIATTYCLQQLRNRKRREAKLETLAPAPGGGEPAAPGAHPLDVLALLRVLETLEPATQEIAVLRHVDQMTLEEIAETVGLSRKTVHKRLLEFQRSAEAHSLGAEHV
jgi:RNA polymerase sigma-70 factor (ECF subfamily)